MIRNTRAALIMVLLASAWAAPAAGGDGRPVKPPKVSERVPFYEQMSPADRKVALHSFDVLWDATETRDWDAARDRLRILLASRVVAGPWKPETVAGLAYCYLFAEYVPRFADEAFTPFQISRFQRWLLAHPKLTRRFVFALCDADDVGAAVKILHELYSDSAKTVVEYPDLAVAMAIVYDKGESSFEQRKDTFLWLTSSQVASAYDLRKLPHELARYVVGQSISREERIWAYDRYHGETNLGNVYKDVEYDRDAHIGKQPKQISEQEYTLPNLQAYGGTCGDRTHYATQVGRTLGWPVAPIRHDGPGIVGHRWCLQLAKVNDEYAWQEVGGSGFGLLLDPASGQEGSDQMLSFLLRSVRQGRARREVAAALTQVALRVPDWVRTEVSADARELRALTARPNPSAAVEGVGSYYTTERKLDPVWLARRALEAEPYNTTAWAAVLTLGRRGQIQPDQLSDLLDRLATLAGDHEPEVAYYALLDAFDYLPPEYERPFLEAAGRVLPPEQIYRAPELSANVILLAGDLLAAEKNFEKALHRYKAAIEVDPDYPPVVVRAVERALPLARQQGKVESFENTCRLIFMRTRDPMFGKEIGRIIEEAGLTRRAINWYCWVYDWSNYNAPGRYDSLRSAIRLLMGLQQYYEAERWSRKLYDATTHPLDGQQLIQVLRAMERTKDVAQAFQLVQENEHRRLQQVAEQAARRAAQVR